MGDPEHAQFDARDAVVGAPFGFVPRRLARNQAQLKRNFHKWIGEGARIAKTGTCEACGDDSPGRADDLLDRGDDSPG